MPPTLSSPRGYPPSVENPLRRIDVDLFRCAERVSPSLRRNKATLTRWRGVFPLHRVESHSDVTTRENSLRHVVGLQITALKLTFGHDIGQPSPSRRSALKCNTRDRLLKLPPFGRSRRRRIFHFLNVLNLNVTANTTNAGWPETSVLPQSFQTTPTNIYTQSIRYETRVL